MLWFLLGWWFGSAEHDEPEHPRYFKEPKPRELTKEEKVQMIKTTILLCIVGLVFAFLAYASYNDTLFHISQITRVVHHVH